MLAITIYLYISKYITYIHLVPPFYVIKTIKIANVTNAFLSRLKYVKNATKEGCVYYSSQSYYISLVLFSII